MTGAGYSELPSEAERTWDCAACAHVNAVRLFWCEVCGVQRPSRDRDVRLRRNAPLLSVLARRELPSTPIPVEPWPETEKRVKR